MRIKLFAILAIVVSCEAKPQTVNPCLALKLAFCKVKKEFAEENGIRQSAPAPPPPVQTPFQTPVETPVQTPAFTPTVAPRRSQSSFNREGDTLIVTPSETISQTNQQTQQSFRPTPPKIKSTLLDRLRSQFKNRGSNTDSKQQTGGSPVRNNNENRGSTDNSNSNDACKGLRFCVLKSNDGSSTNRRPVTTENPVLKASAIKRLLASQGLGPSGVSLMNLVLQGEIEEAKQVIANGADVNQVDNHGNSVLHIAAQNGRAGIIEDLILNGADVNYGNNHQNTAIHLAAQNGWDEVAGHLLRAKKLKVNYKDLHANTALHLAAQNGQLGVAEKLIEAGAKLNEGNAHGLIPLHLAVQNGFNEMTSLLVQNGADLNHQDLIGNTPLHTAFHNSRTEIAQYLIASGANENQKNKSGLTPFDLGK